MTDSGTLAQCEQHGLHYHPELHSGCVLCRKSVPPARVLETASASRAPAVEAQAGSGRRKALRAALIGVGVGVATLVVIAIFPGRLSTLAWIGVAAGLLAAVVTGIWFLVEAFRAGVLWGLAVLFLPLAGLVFAIFVPKGRRAFAARLCALSVLVGCAVAVDHLTDVEFVNDGHGKVVRAQNGDGTLRTVVPHDWRSVAIDNGALASDDILLQVGDPVGREHTVVWSVPTADAKEPTLSAFNAGVLADWQKSLDPYEVSHSKAVEVDGYSGLETSLLYEAEGHHMAAIATVVQGHSEYYTILQLTLASDYAGKERTFARIIDGLRIPGGRT